MKVALIVALLGLTALSGCISAPTDETDDSTQEDTAWEKFKETVFGEAPDEDDTAPDTEDDSSEGDNDGADGYSDDKEEDETKIAKEEKGKWICNLDIRANELDDPKRRYITMDAKGNVGDEHACGLATRNGVATDTDYSMAGLHESGHKMQDEFKIILYLPDGSSEKTEWPYSSDLTGERYENFGVEFPLQEGKAEICVYYDGHYEYKNSLSWSNPRVVDTHDVPYPDCSSWTLKKGDFS